VINGFRFFRNKKRGHLQYWKCRNYYKERCPAIAIHDESTLILRLCHQHQHTESNDIEIKPLPGSETKLAESAEDEAQAEPEAELDNEADPDTDHEPARVPPLIMEPPPLLEIKSKLRNQDF